MGTETGSETGINLLLIVKYTFFTFNKIITETGTGAGFSKLQNSTITDTFLKKKKTLSVRVQ